MNARDLTTYELTKQLRAWADNYPTLVAAISLLAAHETWLIRDEFLDIITLDGELFTGRDQPRASFDAATVLNHAVRRGIPGASASDHAVLAVASSLAGGGVVDLRNVALALDERAAALVAAAILQAGGQ